MIQIAAGVEILDISVGKEIRRLMPLVFGYWCLDLKNNISNLLRKAAVPPIQGILKEQVYPKGMHTMAQRRRHLALPRARRCVEAVPVVVRAIPDGPASLEQHRALQA